VSGHAAVVDESKAALAGCASLEDGGGSGAVGWGHSDGSADEGVDGGIVGEDAKESLDSTSSWLSSAGLKGLESGEPVGGWGDDGWRSSSGESRWGREEGNKVVCDEAPVGVRDGELAGTGSGTIDYSGDMDIESCKTLSSGVEQAVCREDVDQSKGLVSANESIFMRKSVCNCGHSSVGISAFLVLEKGNALGGDGRHFLDVVEVVVIEIWSGEEFKGLRNGSRKS